MSTSVKTISNLHHQPSIPQPTAVSNDIPTASNKLGDDHGQATRPRKPQGYYKELQQGKVSRKGQNAGIADEMWKDPKLEDAEEREEELFAGKAHGEYALMMGGEPKTLKEALQGAESMKWKEAIEAELSQIEKLHLLQVCVEKTGSQWELPSLECLHKALG
ncbi:hypothetical protein AMATHDRAFT_11465 [Amanita thiersii Skay4041]|uniref:Uncharacterized protein n=1 Tax=Amanita thiersii Skay4041 TaxID=703135 RepID=A0A2A9N7B4_9AGAR|nr:hypothetical protein AMATHDRAFT_11465 [Amanita thiersii Skay4041]